MTKDKASKKAGAAGPSPAAGSAVDADAMAFLLEPMTPTDFLQSHWEQKPCVLSASEHKSSFFKGLFDIAALLQLAKERDQDEEGGPLMFGVDMYAARYVDGERETHEGSLIADASTLKELASEGWTFQLHQPQRFLDPLWRLLAALEAQLGCLVGCNAYLTPKGAQGLAPHHDDVEIFVCQTKGSKRWRLYEPMAGFQLPNRVSGDLKEEDIGKPVMEVTLKEGEVLYMPRGTVHQALAQEADSCHLTISTYQHWAWGDMASAALELALAGQSEPACLPLALRKGLPLGSLFKCGLQGDLLAGPSGANVDAKSAAASLAAGLRQLAEHIESTPQLVSAANDAMSVDFLKSRLPPFPTQLADQGPAPTMEDSIICRGKNLFVILPAPGITDPEVPEGFVRLCTCLQNDRVTHMLSLPRQLLGGGGDDDDEDEVEFGSSEGEDEDDENESEEDEDEEEKADQKGTKKEGKKGNGKDADEEEACTGKPGCGHDHHDHGNEDDGDEGSEGDDDEDTSSDVSDDDDVPALVMPASYAPALAQVLAATSAPGVRVKDLKLPEDDPQGPLKFAFMLWSDGIAATIPGAKKEKVGGGKASDSKRPAAKEGKEPAGKKQKK